MKKTLAILLSLALVICMIPATAVTAYAADGYTVTVNGTYTYNGKAQIPDITVKDGDTTLASSVYSVTYQKDNTTVTEPIDVGSYTITVTEKNPAEGSTAKTGTANFTIFLDIETSAVQVTSTGSIADTYVVNNEVPLDQSGLTFYLNGYTNSNVFNSKSLKVSVTAVTDTTATLSVEGTGNLTGARTGITVKRVAGLTSGNTTVTAYSRPTYNGTAQNVRLTVIYQKDTTSSKISLTQGTDFTVTPATVTNVADRTFTINGIGKYAGVVTGKVVDYIQPKAVGTTAGSNNIKVSSIPTQVLGAQPVVKVTDIINGKETELTLGKDYVCAIKTDTLGKNAGNAIITFQGNYSGSRTLTFDVVDSNADLSNAEVYVDTAWSNTYSGKAQYPNNIAVYMTVSGERTKLTKDVDYTVEYQYTKKGKSYSVTNPTDANIYTVVIKGKGKYGGQKEAATSFMIKQYDMKNVTVTASVTSAYNTPAVTVKGANGVTFEKEKDYTVYYYTNGNKTTMYVSVTPTGDGNLTGSSFSKNYTISARSMSYCTVTFRDGRSSAAYTGSAIPVDVYVLDGSTTLTKGVHYNVVYRNSAGKVVSAIRDAGTYTVEVVGDGGYTGTRTLTFTVTGNDISGYTVNLKEYRVTADGRSKTPTVTSVTKGSLKLYSGDYTVSYQDADGKAVSYIIAPGTYKVVVKGAGKYSGSTYATFTVVGKSQSITGVDSSYKAYPGGETIQLYPKATEGKFTYTSSDSTVATVSASGLVTPLKAGRAKITIKTTGNSTYDPATYSTVIKVYPKKAVMTKKPWNVKKGQVKVRWNKQDNVTRYEIRYSRAKNFAKGTYLTKKVNAAQNDYTTQSTTLKNLKSGKRYYVKVRAVKEVYNDYGKKLTYYGAWSGWRSVVVK